MNRLNVFSSKQKTWCYRQGFYQYNKVKPKNQYKRKSKNYNPNYKGKKFNKNYKNRNNKFSKGKQYNKKS